MFKIRIFQNSFRDNIEEAVSLQCVIDIQGMKCQSCVRKITDTLTEKDGVTNVLINLELKEGVVMYEGSKIGPQQITEIVQNLGFISTLKLSR